MRRPFIPKLTLSCQPGRARQGLTIGQTRMATQEALVTLLEVSKMAALAAVICCLLWCFRTTGSRQGTAALAGSECHANFIVTSLCWDISSKFSCELASKIANILILEFSAASVTHWHNLGSNFSATCKPSGCRLQQLVSRKRYFFFFALARRLCLPSASQARPYHISFEKQHCSDPYERTQCHHIIFCIAFTLRVQCKLVRPFPPPRRVWRHT